MRLGFLVRPLNNLNFFELVKWAVKAGYDALEVDVRPGNNHIDVTKLNSIGAKKIKKLLTKNNLIISSLGYYPNNLEPNDKKRTEYNNHLKKTVDVCNLLDIDVVGTFMGSIPGETIERNIEAVGKYFTPLVQYANDRNVKIAIENCPVSGGFSQHLTPYAPGNIAYCPENWDQIFKEVGLKNLGLNLDPAHLCWQEINYVEVARQYGGRVFHSHAQDVEFINSRKIRAGNLFSMRDKFRGGSKTGTWRYRQPGWGIINWAAYISALFESGYNYVLSVEQKDPIFKGERAEEGLLKAAKYLKPYILNP